MFKYLKFLLIVVLFFLAILSNGLYRSYQKQQEQIKRWREEGRIVCNSMYTDFKWPFLSTHYADCTIKGNAGEFGYNDIDFNFHGDLTFRIKLSNLKFEIFINLDSAAIKDINENGDVKRIALQLASRIEYDSLDGLKLLFDFKESPAFDHVQYVELEEMGMQFVESNEKVGLQTQGEMKISGQFHRVDGAVNSFGAKLQIGNFVSFIDLLHNNQNDILQHELNLMYFDDSSGVAFKDLTRQSVGISSLMHMNGSLGVDSSAASWSDLVNHCDIDIFMSKSQKQKVLIAQYLGYKFLDKLNLYNALYDRGIIGANSFSQLEEMHRIFEHFLSVIGSHSDDGVSLKMKYFSKDNSLTINEQSLRDIMQQLLLGDGHVHKKWDLDGKGL